MVMPGKDSKTDLTLLDKLLTERGIKHELRVHPVAAEEPVKDIIGYNPAADWQIIIDDKYSVIRGAVSFGAYEIMNIAGGRKFETPERFSSATALVAAL